MPVKSKVKILQNFVAFSEYMNFKGAQISKIILICFQFLQNGQFVYNFCEDGKKFSHLYLNMPTKPNNKTCMLKQYQIKICIYYLKFRYSERAKKFVPSSTYDLMSNKKWKNFRCLSKYLNFTL